MNTFKKTETKNKGRYYVFTNGKRTIKYPSVTTILGATSDDTWLVEWRKRIGKENADKISKFSSNRGTAMHLYGERYMDDDLVGRRDLKKVLVNTYEELKPDYTEREIKVGRDLFFNFHNSGSFNKIKKVIMQEQALYNHDGGGYAGRVDFIYQDILNDIIIADFKSSKKPKGESYIEGYKMQLSAYYTAYQKMKNVELRYGEIWISNEESTTPQLIVVSKTDLTKYYKMFLEKVKQYHSMFAD